MKTSDITVKKIVGGMSDEELVQLVKDYDKFEEKCCIGDCLLRQKVNEMCNDKDIVYFHLLATGLTLHAQRELLSRNKII
jgi:hypothetical protein